MATAFEGKLRRSTTAIDVARVLRERILAGTYDEDQFIRQELVATELGVSRIPVREALAQLESEGLVVREKFRGAMVPRLSNTEIEEIYALRLMIEPYLLRAAIEQITDKEIGALGTIIKRSRRAKDVGEWAELNVDFHRTLYRAADRPLSLQLLDNLLNRADRYFKVQRVLSSETHTESDAEHARILDAVAARDPDTAVDLLCAHIRWNKSDMTRTIEPKS